MDTRLEKVKVTQTENERNSHINVLDKVIFANVFGKDIRRVFIYKRTERIAQAIHMLMPAFAQSPHIREKVDALSVNLIEAATLKPSDAKEEISRLLLMLSSVLAVAESSRVLSHMNASILSKEIEELLGEVSLYEEPRVSLPDTPSLAHVFSQYDRMPEKRSVQKQGNTPARKHSEKSSGNTTTFSKRQSDILDIIKDKREVEIKDISLTLRDVSEKTIQRELATLVERGLLKKEGRRRWTRYRLA